MPTERQTNGIQFLLDPTSGVPFYRQIIMQTEMAIADGRLRTGIQLPTVRGLAVDLQINPNTVARAYRRLERAGLVTTKTGSGTFVSDPKLRRGDAADMSILAERMDTVITRGVNLGLEADDLMEMFKDRTKKFLKIKKREGEK